MTFWVIWRLGESGTFGALATHVCPDVSFFSPKKLLSLLWREGRMERMGRLFSSEKERKKERKNAI